MKSRPSSKQARPVDEAEEIVKKNLDGTNVKKRRCETCGQVIPHWMGVCPACLDRGKLLFRLLKYSLPYWKLAACSLLLLLTATTIGLMPPLLMSELIDEVLAPAAGRAAPAIPHPRTEIRSQPPRERAAPVRPAGSESRETLAILVFLLLLVNISRNGLSAFRSYLMALLGQRITFNLRHEVYQHLHHLSLSFYNERETGRIMASVTQDVNRLQDFISDGLQEVIRNIATLIIICIILFSRNAGLAALVLLPTPLLVFATIHFGERLHHVYHGLWRRWAGLSALLADVIPGVRVVKAFAQEKREVSRFEGTSWGPVERRNPGCPHPKRLYPDYDLPDLPGHPHHLVGGRATRSWAGSLTLGDFVAFTA